MNAVGNVADALNPGVKVGGEYFRYDQLRDRFGMLSEDSILVVALQKLVSVSAFPARLHVSGLSHISYRY